MESKKISRISLVSILFAISVDVAAQTPPTPDFSPPTVEMVDKVGVSLNSGRANFTIAPVGIGPQGDRFTFSQSFEGGTMPKNQTGGFLGKVAGTVFGSSNGPGLMVVTVLGKSEVLTPAGDGVNYVSKSQRGGSLSISSSAGAWVYRYVDRDGVVYDFNNTYDPGVCADHLVTTSTAVWEIKGYSGCAFLQHVTWPDGRSLDIGPQFNVSGDATRSVQKITRSDGFQFVLEYANLPYTAGTYLEVNPSSRLTKVTAYNMASDYCDSAATSCNFSRAWPAATYSWTPEKWTLGDQIVLTVTDSAGLSSRYTEQIFVGTASGTFAYRLLVGIKPPSSASADTVTYNYANQPFCFTYYANQSQITDCSTYVRDELMQSVVTGMGTWTYSYTHEGAYAPIQTMLPGQYTTTVKRPDGFSSVGVYNALTGYIASVTGTNGSVIYDTAWQTDPNVITSTTDAEGRDFGYHFDARGNLRWKQQYPDLGNLVQAAYPDTCASAASCNKPTQIIDANHKITDYTWDPVHGGMLTMTRPADVNGVRPQTRYAYVQRTPWLKNASGGYSAGAPIWKVASESYCRTSQSTGSGCSVAGDEVVTAYDYGPDAGPNNLLLRGSVVTADGTSHRTCYAYDPNGDRISQTTPGAGLASCP